MLFGQSKRLTNSFGSRTAVFVIVMAALVVACGGSRRGESTTSTPESRGLGAPTATANVDRVLELSINYDVKESDWRRLVDDPTDHEMWCRWVTSPGHGPTQPNGTPWPDDLVGPPVDLVEWLATTSRQYFSTPEWQRLSSEYDLIASDNHKAVLREDLNGDHVATTAWPVTVTDRADDERAVEIIREECGLVTPTAEPKPLG